MSLNDTISHLRAELTAAIAAAADEAALDAVRVAALGKKGSVSALLATLGTMPPEERRTAGPAINGLKAEIAGAVDSKAAALRAAALDARLAAETVDVTLPVRPAPTAQGRIHPISQVWDEITAIFSDMGFTIAEGPDIETDWYNFTALNFPEGHPAREMHDTFFLQPGPDGTRKVLRTHTSPVQIRSMKQSNEKPAAGYLTG
ncbi:MAG TPA: phenylalanine--tRNA ligase subunit alpha, partial [Devosia sp.]|nr:phenylalanine--tRNA ligase subunit alpha [Devosia sp.]